MAIAAQPDRVMFIEAINGKSDTEVLVAEVAQRYVAIMQRMEYQAVGINLRGYVEQETADAPREYIAQNLLAPGAWQEFGEEPMRATLNLSYALQEGRFSMSVNDATLQMPEETEKPVILFSGNFSYDLSTAEEAAKLEKLSSVIGNWQSDVDTFRDLVNTKFLVNGGEQLPLVNSLLETASV